MWRTCYAAPKKNSDECRTAYLISPISIITAVVSFGVHSFVDKGYGVMMLFRLKTMTIAELGKLFHGPVETLQEFTPDSDNHCEHLEK